MTDTERSAHDEDSKAHPPEGERMPKAKRSRAASKPKVTRKRSPKKKDEPQPRGGPYGNNDW